MDKEYIYAMGYWDGRKFGNHSEWASINEYTSSAEYKRGYDCGVADYCLLDIKEENY